MAHRTESRSASISSTPGDDHFRRQAPVRLNRRDDALRRQRAPSQPSRRDLELVPSITTALLATSANSPQVRRSSSRSPRPHGKHDPSGRKAALPRQEEQGHRETKGTDAALEIEPVTSCRAGGRTRASPFRTTSTPPGRKGEEGRQEHLPGMAGRRDLRPII